MLVSQAKRGVLPLFLVLFSMIRDDFFNLLFLDLPKSMQNDLWSRTYQDYDSEEGFLYSFSLRGNSVDAKSKKRRRVH